jgi:hypothetical protein
MKSIAFLAILLLTGCASAASVPWENLQATILDKQVVVRDTDGVSTRGVVRGINDREVMMVRGNGEALTIPREWVERVQLWSRGTGATKGLMWGAAVGAVVYGIGALVYLGNEGTVEEAGGIAAIFAAGTAMFAGAGGAIGAAAGGVTTVYQTPKATGVTAGRGIVAPFEPMRAQRRLAPRHLWGPAASTAEPPAAGHGAVPPYLAAPTESR